jgi:hypothetical protein
MDIDRCGPYKLAKALEFCLRNRDIPQRSPMMESQLSSPGLLYDASQSLFGMSSPESQADQGERPFRREYFPSPTPIRVAEALSPAADDAHPERQKPLLLLVEDNEINLKVYLPS